MSILVRFQFFCLLQKFNSVGYFLFYLFFFLDNFVATPLRLFYRKRGTGFRLRGSLGRGRSLPRGNSSTLGRFCPLVLDNIYKCFKVCRAFTTPTIMMLLVRREDAVGRSARARGGGRRQYLQRGRARRCDRRRREIRVKKNRCGRRCGG